MRLVNKISLSFFAVAFIMVCAGGGFFYFFAKDNIEKAILNHLISVAASKTDHIETYLKMLESSVGQFSKSVAMEKLLKTGADDVPVYAQVFDDAMTRLRRTREADPLVSEYFLLDRFGKVIASSDERSIGLDKSQEEYFLDGRDRIHIDDVRFCQEHKDYMLMLSAPILDSRTGEFLGEIAAWTRLDYLNAIVTDRMGLGKTGEIYIVNKDGYMITPSRFKSVLPLGLKVDSEGSKEARMHTTKEHPLSGSRLMHVYPDYRGIPVLGVHEFIPSMHWAVLAEIDVAEVLTPLVALRVVLVLLIIFSSCGSWLLGMFLARWITAPLLRLAESVEKIGKGEEDFKIDSETDDEVGDLAKGFVRMFLRLKETTTSIDNLTEEIEARRVIEEALTNEKVFSHSLIRSLPGFFFVLDRQGNIVRSNQYLESFSGFTEGQLVGKPGLIVIFEEDRVVVAAKIKEVFEKGSAAVEVRCKSAADEIREFFFTGVRMDIEGSQFLVGNGVDITERKKAAEALKIDQKRNELLLSLHKLMDADPKEIFDFVIKAACEGTCSEFSFVGLLEENETVMVIHALSPKAMEQCGVSGKPIRFSVKDAGMWGDCVRRRKPCVYNDYDDDIPSKKGCPPGHVPIKNFFALPIFDGNSIVVVVAVANKTGEYAQSDIDFINVLGERMWEMIRRKNAEDNLRRSEQLYHGIFANIGIGVSVISPNMEIVSLNPIMKQWFPHIDVGKRPVCYRSFNTPPSETPCSYCPTIYSLSDGNIHTSTTDTPTPDGIRNYRIISAAIKSQDGVVTGAIEVVEDITDIVNAERSVRAERDKAQRYLNTAEVMLLALDRQGCITLINRKGCQMLGYEAGELVGKNWFELFVPQQEASGVRQAYDKIISGDIVPVEYFENPIRVKGGGERLIAWHNTTLKDESGRIVGTLSSGEDITERKKSENDLREAYKELKATQDKLLQASKMAAIGQLAGGVAHEINNPLTGILGNVQLIEQMIGTSDAVSSQELKDILKVVEDSAVRCRKITRALLDFAHPAKDAFLPVDINAVVDKVMQIISNELKLSGVAVVRELQPDIPPVIGDSQLLQQALLGLIANAKWAVDKKMNNPDGMIIIKTYHDPQARNVVVSVDDDGVGIPQENLPRMFEPFFTTKDVGEGTGLGLALIYNIVKNHGGTISIDSRVDIGTTVKIALPIL